MESYSRDDDQAHSPQVDFVKLNAALASSNPATAFNPFGGAQNAALIDTMRTSQYLGKGRNTEQQSQIKVDGPLFTIPGGAVRAAVGVESLQTSNDFTFISGPTNNLAIKRDPISRIDNAVFGELFVPLVSAMNAMPGIQRLDLSIAGRYEKYSDVGSTSNPKVGISWSPAGGITGRASYGTSFRAPEPDRPQPGAGRPGRGDLQRTRSRPPARPFGVSITGGNPDLNPETATTYTVGVDPQPAADSGLKASFTAFRIDYEKPDRPVPWRHHGPAARGAVLIDHHAQPAGLGDRAADRHPSADGRRASAGDHGPDPTARPAEPRQYALRRGLDFQLSYHWNTSQFGDFELATNGTYFWKYDFKVTPTAAAVDSLNHIFNPLKWRDRTTLRWNDGPWSASATLNYTNSYLNDRATVPQTVDSYKTVTTSTLAYKFGDKFMAMLNNVTVGLRVTETCWTRSRPM